MDDKRNRWSKAAFICSLVPILVTVVCAGLCLPIFLNPPSRGCFSGLEEAFFILFCGFIIVVVTMPLGIISVVSGIIAVKKPEARGKTLARVAVVLGVLEIVTVTGCLFWFVSQFC